MQKDAIISIKSFTELDKKDIIEVVTPGKFFVEGNMFKAVYEETEISGMAGTTTTLSITDEMFILEREGSTATKMEFKKGDTSISLYNTPYGMMDLQIDTKFLEIDIDENGGDLVAKYSMAISGQEPLMTKIVVNIKIQ
ncbi:DUF1934 domain-containing protein [Clostridium septicum]|uniref:DUF1934 domain-containing protein n=1 Tax=Clostridium septicum TaxID=1504 RepID=A0A9N7PJE6_CLOSE|nr:DUF1934 domain-containing protein [Clostridium septicum]AYE34721.1 DUF1934 domain-containing protein [Clostridium septicum]MDU1312770.1 DUF1934 domain-containing protein [Clostridium septicum]QAS60122.1 DUF1934 domain-containing protein [Clostridium septicum]UEC20632.1 DUF1934 domain-containing protein [Clostridium septicum]USS01316.1 DUF1934 domain-containing protein [Clostridium septicum]